MEGCVAEGATPDLTVSDTVAKNDAQQLQKHFTNTIIFFQ
jgi:hypothetical protein